MMSSRSTNHFLTTMLDGVKDSTKHGKLPFLLMMLEQFIELCRHSKDPKLDKNSKEMLKLSLKLSRQVPKSLTSLLSNLKKVNSILMKKNSNHSFISVSEKVVRFKSRLLPFTPR